jgi:DNA topoisomerase-1
VSKLVIVESPTKARTIRSYLPDDYRVEASMGHVRDLPASAAEIPSKVKEQEWARLGVNVEAGFEPLYVVPKDKKAVVKELKDAIKNAEELILATDEDREGESIAWHLTEVLKPNVPVKRMVFHEITREAILDALKHCRTIDERLVHAQETRRILDRLVGYTVSPLLWKKIAPGLSAGRVQSAAVRLLVLREQERRSFKSGTYWDLKATLAAGNETFTATLVTLGGVRLATGKDFDNSTGTIPKGRKVVLLDEARARELADRLFTREWRVTDLSERDETRSPAPPFTTSTLQQEANRKLGMTARETMSIAQRLYERGLITYMRTDSVHLSKQALAALRQCVRDKYGEDYLHPTPRQYRTRSKGAQEAHEAIRPAGHRMPTADELKLTGQEYRLYDLIWKRSIATQMAEARLRLSTVTVTVEDAEFRASGRRVLFPGFFRAYVEGADDPAAALDDQEMILPPLHVDQVLDCRALEPQRHETAPPPRYTDATLVKALESEGIGRPSTYATILSTIEDRGYVEKNGKQLIPTFTAFAVNHLLEQHFPELVDTQFTAQMEQVLDEIAMGNAESQPYLETFFLGDEGLEQQVRVKEQTINPRDIHALELEKINARVRIGPYGPYLEQEVNGDVVRVSLPQNLSPGDLTVSQAEQLLRQKGEGPQPLGYHPETGEPIFVLVGRYGPYVQQGENGESDNGSGRKPPRVSLPKGVRPETVTFEQALQWLSLPRTLGTHPETGEPVEAGVGRYGPYVRHAGTYRSLKKDDDVLTITLDRALELLSEQKSTRRQAEPLRTLGEHPETGEPVVVYEGRYGPYVKHGSVNASLPKGVGVNEITLEQALSLLAEKASKPASGRKSTRRKSSTTKSDGVASTSKKSTTKKTSGAKKTGTRKSNSRKSAGE